MEVKTMRLFCFLKTIRKDGMNAPPNRSQSNKSEG